MMIAKVRTAINNEYRRLSRLALVGILLLLLLQIVGSYLLYVLLWQHTLIDWIREVFIATVFLLIVGAAALYSLYASRIRLIQKANSAIADELFVMQSTIERFEALQVMASTLSATLSFERVVDQAVNVCGLALEDLGVARQSLIGAVFLFNGDNLVPLQITPVDQGKMLAGNEGVVGEALRQQERARLLEQTERLNHQARSAAARAKFQANEEISRMEHEHEMKKLELKGTILGKESVLEKKGLEDELERNRMRLAFERDELEVLKSSPELLMLTPQAARLAEASQNMKNARTIVSLSPQELMQGSELLGVFQSLMQRALESKDTSPNEEK